MTTLNLGPEAATALLGAVEDEIQQQCDAINQGMEPEDFDFALPHLLIIRDILKGATTQYGYTDKKCATCGAQVQTYDLVGLEEMLDKRPTFQVRIVKISGDPRELFGPMGYAVQCYDCYRRADEKCVVVR